MASLFLKHRLRVGSLSALLVVTSAVIAAPAAGAPPVPRVGNCPIFTPSNQWNQRVDRLPKLRGSSNMIRRIGRTLPLHPDFGSGRWRGGLIGIPYTTVDRSQRPKPIAFRDAAYSDPGPYPIPTTAPIEDRPDRHVITVDTHNCRLYEVYGGSRRPGGRTWRGGSGATWDLRSDRLRPNGWTSADAAGLPIFAGLVRHDEVEQGEIGHALRIAVPMTRRAWIYPARHASSKLRDPALPAMGQRLRLRSSVKPNRFPPQARVIVRALKRYGALVADHGASKIHLTGAPSAEWNMSQVFALSRLRARDFEAVDTRSLPRPSP